MQTKNIEADAISFGSIRSEVSCIVIQITVLVVLFKLTVLMLIMFNNFFYLIKKYSRICSYSMIIIFFIKIYLFILI